MQGRLLHGGDEEASVRTHDRAEMRASPFELLRIALGLGKPERDAIVVRDGEAESVRRESQTADRGRHFERALGALSGPRKCLFSCRPRHRFVRSGRHLIDPAASGVAGEKAARAVRSTGHDLAVIAAGDDALGIGRARKYRAIVDSRSSLHAIARDRDQRLLAEHEHRSAAEEMRCDDGGIRVDRPRALDDGGDIALAVAHRSRA